MKHTHGARGRFTIRLAGFFAALALVACSSMLSDTPPLTVPLGASMPGEPPEPVPLWRFFANRESTWGYKVSPDGQRLGWIASHARRAQAICGQRNSRRPVVLRHVVRPTDPCGLGRRVLIVSEEPPDLNKTFDDVRAWT